MHPLIKAANTAGLSIFPCWARYNNERSRWDKGPAVPRGESWKLTAQRPLDDPVLNWSDNVIGIIIPPGVIVLDVDEYKGVTLSSIEQYLRCSPDWGRALIQSTLSGGKHYAFRCAWPARQIQDGRIPGLDTRTSGRGFICSGKGYTPADYFGVLRLAHPNSLPEIPDAAREVLGAPTPTNTVTIPECDNSQVIAALRYIDPGSTRAEWVLIGLALKNYYAEDDSAGFDIFSRWSAGEYWPTGAPHNYVESDLDKQWKSFKPDGRTHAATLFYKAIQGGWVPPSNFNTASAFGASVEVFANLIARIREAGGDLKQVPELIGSIKSSDCNALQIALLAAEMKGALKDAGTKDRAVNKHIDLLLTQHDARSSGSYTNNDCDNAAIFLDRHYPDSTLIKSDGEYYSYDGKVWGKLSVDRLKNNIAIDMSSSRPQAARVNAAIDLVTKFVSVKDGVINRAGGDRIIFQNAVLNLTNGYLEPHNPALYSTVLLPYDYIPNASAPRWMQFLLDIFEGDLERVALLQEWFGYMLTRDYRFQKVMLLLGPKRSGKGTIGRMFETLIGPANFTGGSLSDLASDSFLDSLRTKTVLFIGDAAKKVNPQKVNQVIERIKSISGNDPIYFDRKFISGLSDTLPTRITIAANGVPHLFDDSGALASRILVLPFFKTFYGSEDLDLFNKLLPEVPNIATWSLEGLRRLRTNGRFTEPGISKEEARELNESYSPIIEFIKDRCILDRSYWISTQQLYTLYLEWCTRKGDIPLARRAFYSAIREQLRGVGVRKSGDNFIGIGAYTQ